VFPQTLAGRYIDSVDNTIKVTHISDAVRDGWGRLPNFTVGPILPAGLAASEVESGEFGGVGGDVDRVTDNGRGALNEVTAIPRPEQFECRG
jgi:hypothetical protein